MATSLPAAVMAVTLFTSADHTTDSNCQLARLESKLDAIDGRIQELDREIAELKTESLAVSAQKAKLKVESLAVSAQNKTRLFRLTVSAQPTTDAKSNPIEVSARLDGKRIGDQIRLRPGAVNFEIVGGCRIRGSTNPAYAWTLSGSTSFDLEPSHKKRTITVYCTTDSKITREVKVTVHLEAVEDY